MASKGGNGASTAGVDDNCGGPDGKNGYFAYHTGGVFPDMIPGGTFQVRVRITIPVGVDHTQDVTTLSAFSQYEGGLCASARDTTAIGILTLTPTPQAKAVAAGQTVDYGLTLGNNSGVSDVFDLRITSSQGWRRTERRSPPHSPLPATGGL